MGNCTNDVLTIKNYLVKKSGILVRPNISIKIKQITQTDYIPNVRNVVKKSLKDGSKKIEIESMRLIFESIMKIVGVLKIVIK